MNASRARDKIGVESVCWMGRFWAAKYSIGNATVKELYQSPTKWMPQTGNRFAERGPPGKGRTIDRLF
jgi:hypothetical protein